jgi:IS30 family transposase
MARRTSLSYEQQREIWTRWKSGECTADIARSLAVSRDPVRHILVSSGGIAPEMRRRSGRQLSFEEREAISRGLAARRSMREISQSLGRCPSTISREVHRNGGARSYRAAAAEAHAWERACRPKPCLLAGNERLRDLVAERLSWDWSPKQISRWLERAFPNDHNLRVSAETIYRSLFVQARGVLKKELLGHLRMAGRIRRPSQDRSEGLRGKIVGAVSIRERPAEAQDRAVPGHWEGDLLAGSGNSYIATLVERHTRFVMLIKLPGKDTTSVIAALTRHIRQLPAELRRSLTWDRGHEMADHAKFTIATNVQVYFCDPQSPWQRGSNENTNGLLRQYFPKGTDLSGYSQSYLNQIALRLNTRPRETLGFASPAETLAAVLDRSVALIH